jgi:hypothetical protein
VGGDGDLGQRGGRGRRDGGGGGREGVGQAGVRRVHSAVWGGFGRDAFPFDHGLVSPFAGRGEGTVVWVAAPVGESS